MQHDIDSIPTKDYDDLSALVDKLQKKNDQQEQHIKTMIEERGILHDMMKLAENEKEVAVKLSKKELEMEIDQQRQKCASISDEITSLKKNYRREMKRMKAELAKRAAEEEDLTWKIDALEQNMELRLKEKDSIISQLNKKLKNYRNNTSLLTNEIRKRDAEKSFSEFKLDAKIKLESTIEEQHVELEQKDVIISNLRNEESQYKSEILRMQAKVDTMEQWLHESLAFNTPPGKGAAKSNPQSPARISTLTKSPRTQPLLREALMQKRSNEHSSLKSSSNPQSPAKNPSKQYMEWRRRKDWISATQPDA